MWIFLGVIIKRRMMFNSEKKNNFTHHSSLPIPKSGCFYESSNLVTSSHNMNTTKRLIPESEHTHYTLLQHIFPTQSPIVCVCSAFSFCVTQNPIPKSDCPTASRVSRNRERISTTMIPIIFTISTNILIPKSDTIFITHSSFDADSQIGLYNQHLLIPKSGNKNTA